ncbi:MAG: RNA 2',3'-cyclic phosphodiesterase [Bacteroidales bacterium]|nr:RNA 2',3'-cyclic phosphodiesterase [Bacteroidales bacterium]
MNKELNEIYFEITDDEITIIGISTSIASLSLVQKINSLLSTNFKLYKDFESYDKETEQITHFKNYYYNNSPHRLKNFLLSNRNDENHILIKDKKLLKEKKAFDYIYILIGRDHNRHSKTIIDKIKMLPNISLIRTIYPPDQETNIPSTKQIIKEETLDLFDNNSENNKTTKTNKKPKQNNLNIWNIIQDIEYNLGNTMYEKRLFLGFKLTLNEKILKQIKQTISHFGLEDIKPIKAENYHLTLCFIGNTSQKQMNKINVIVQEILEKEYTNDLEIIINGIDYFEQNNNITAIHLKFEEHAELLKLNKKIKGALQTNNLYNINRDFIPHITIANIKNLKDKTKREEIKTEFGKETEQIKLSPIILFESISIDNTKRYDTLQLFDIPIQR